MTTTKNLHFTVNAESVVALCRQAWLYEDKEEWARKTLGYLAYGIGVDPDDLTSTDSLVELGGSTRLSASARRPLGGSWTASCTMICHGGRSHEPASYQAIVDN